MHTALQEASKIKKVMFQVLDSVASFRIRSLQKARKVEFQRTLQAPRILIELYVSTLKAGL